MAYDNYPLPDYETTPLLQAQGVIKDGVLICYGNGAELGDLSQYAKSLEKNYATKNTKINSTQTRDDLHTAIMGFTGKITEVHIISHAFGSGLALGYHEETLTSARDNFINSGASLTYKSVVNFERGVLLSDHLVGNNFDLNIRDQVRTKLASCKLIKLWGCNSGVSDWSYGDTYWEKLNDENTPKLSIAQALANFMNVTVYGAKSGCSPEYLIDGSWISGNEYSEKYMKDYPYPREYSRIRLTPDKGNYEPFVPK